MNARFALAGLLALLAFVVRPVVRELDPWLAVQAAVLHDEDLTADPWGNPWRFVAGYHDSDSLIYFSTGPDGINRCGDGDDLIPAFSLAGWGLAPWGKPTLPPMVWPHNIVLCCAAQWEDDDSLPYRITPLLDRDRTQRLMALAEDRRVHVLAALIGWSRELCLGAAVLLVVVPFAWRQLRAPRSTTRRELLRSVLLGLPPGALAAVGGWSWGPTHARTPVVSLLPAPVTCAVSAAGAVLLVVLAWRLSRCTRDVPGIEKILEGHDVAPGVIAGVRSGT